jgi:flagellar basal body P-ring formation protein FlgA
VIVPATENGWSLRVKDLRVTDRRFQAHLVVCESGHIREHRTLVSGQWVDHMSVPVLKKSINPGEVIGQQDLVLVNIRGDRVRPDMIADPLQLVGKTPTHGSLAAGEPLRMTELKLPQVIQRNAIVTMIVETPLLLVTARGRALNDAAAGEEALVANLDTKKVVSGIAVRSGVVSLRPSGSY